MSHMAIDLSRQAMMTALVLVSPVLLVGLMIGVIAGVIQTVTQVQDQSLSHVPRIVGVLAAFAICLPWFLQKLVEYSDIIFRNVPFMIGGG